MRVGDPWCGSVLMVARSGGGVCGFEIGVRYTLRSRWYHWWCCLSMVLDSLR